MSQLPSFQMPLPEPIPESEPVLGSALQVGKSYSRRGRTLGVFIRYVTDPLTIIPSTLQSIMSPSALSTIVGNTPPSYSFDNGYVHGNLTLTFTEVV